MHMDDVPCVWSQLAREERSESKTESHEDNNIQNKNDSHQALRVREESLVVGSAKKKRWLTIF